MPGLVRKEQRLEISDMKLLDRNKDQHSRASGHPCELSANAKDGEPWSWA